MAMNLVDLQVKMKDMIKVMEKAILKVIKKEKHLKDNRKHRFRNSLVKKRIFRLSRK